MPYAHTYWIADEIVSSLNNTYIHFNFPGTQLPKVVAIKIFDKKALEGQEDCEYLTEALQREGTCALSLEEEAAFAFHSLAVRCGCGCASAQFATGSVASVANLPLTMTRHCRQAPPINTFSTKHSLNILLHTAL